MSEGDIGSRIISARKKAGIKQIALAKQIGTSTSVIRNWERNKTAPTLHNLMSMCDALGCSADFILGLKDNEREGNMARYIRALNIKNGYMQSRSKDPTEKAYADGWNACLEAMLGLPSVDIPDAVVIGIRIKYLRESLNMTMEDLSDELKQCITTVARWENGKRKPSDQNMDKLCELFGCSKRFLLGAVDDEWETDEDQR